ncbi:hypothetical protein ACIBI4_21415 [Streptomyces sp. NPDC050418]|uniref:hypothetical protein n=1 Tax=Streptomyces sp. NPDC050418 TaxID=3365612 RepID=UPI0037B8DEE8
MHRGLVHGVAWTCATGAAVTLSWWGVHTVMAGTAYDRPRTPSLSAPQETTQQAADAETSATNRPKEPSKSAKQDDKGGSRKPSESGKGSGDGGAKSPSGTPSAPSSSSGSSSANGKVKSYSVSGGQVVFEIHGASAELVSATPRTGWQMQIWNQPELDWIRVTFTQDGREVSVFCTWHDHPPQVEIDDP